MTQAAAVVPIRREDDNPYKVVNQYRKARKLANAMVQAGATAHTIGNADATTIRFAAAIAEVDVPSETTWALAVELVKEATT